jgi:hypothetical protein
VERKKKKVLTPTALTTLVSHECGRQQKNTKLFEANDATARVTRSD